MAAAGEFEDGNGAALDEQFHAAAFQAEPGGDFIVSKERFRHAGRGVSTPGPSF